jgi:hypothetical protein
MRTSDTTSTLPLFGPAQLQRDHTPVRMRQKGLGLLYLLALEGSMRREQISDLLWNHGRAASNLRVELHRLREALSQIGIQAFPPGEDPLSLPDGIELDRTPRNGCAEVMQGLDELSSSFDEWLEIQRTRLGGRHEATREPLRRELVEQVARELRQPFLLVLHGLPGAGRSAFVEALAQRLKLPVVQGAMSTKPAVHVIGDDIGSPRDVAHHIMEKRDGVWVILESSLGQDSELLLRLRNLYPVERLRYLEFGALPWHEARALMSALAFDEAARIYIESGGNYGFMRELLLLRPPDGFVARLPLPQRIRAAYLLEANRLDAGSRDALDQLSVHPGTLSQVVLARLGLSVHVDELEAAGWLRFGTAWGFCQETARRVLYRSLLPGRRLHLHARFAEAFSAVDADSAIAAMYHGSMAGVDGISTAPVGIPCAWARAVIEAKGGTSTEPIPPSVPVSGRRECAALLEEHAGLQVHDEGGWSYWVRNPLDSHRTFADYALPDVDCLLQFSIRLFTENVLNVGVAGNAVPLRLWFRSGDGPDRVVTFGAVAAPAVLPDGTLLLPDRPPRQVAFVCHHRNLRVETCAEAGIIEFQLGIREMGRPQADSVEAYDLLHRVDQGSTGGIVGRRGAA